MEIKKKILKLVIWTDDDILYIVSHHLLAYFWTIVTTLIMLAIAFFLYYVFSYLNTVFATWLAWIAWALIYLYFFFRFIDIYLDAIVITQNSIIIYKWYWIFKSTTDVIEFSAVESVYSDQEWVLNFLFNNWNIFIRRAMYTNVFNNVHNPWNISDNINKIIKSIESNKEKENNNEEKKDDSDFNLFVEAMAEIIRDYKNK